MFLWRTLTNTGFSWFSVWSREPSCAIQVVPTFVHERGSGLGALPGLAAVCGGWRGARVILTRELLPRHCCSEEEPGLCFRAVTHTEASPWMDVQLIVRYVWESSREGN